MIQRMLQDIDFHFAHHFLPGHDRIGRSVQKGRSTNGAGDIDGRFVRLVDARVVEKNAVKVVHPVFSF